MGKLCERPGCSDVAAMAYGFDVDRLLVWLAPRDPDADPARAGSLVQAPRRRDGRASRLDARRPRGSPSRACSVPKPDEAAATGAAAPAAPPQAGGRRQTPAVGAVAEPTRRRAPGVAERRPPPRCVEELDEARTVAEVTGEPSATDDPDATQAIPWLPTFDEHDDLDGVLSAPQPAARPGVQGHRPQALMQTTASLFIDGASATDVFEQLATLDRYPAWMRLVHRAEALAPDDGRPAWRVELRARVGPFARSKQLRMVRTVHEPPHRVRFERVQDDDRDHAAWILAATVERRSTAAPGVVTELATAGSSGARACWSACSRTRSAGARPR